MFCLRRAPGKTDCSSRRAHLRAWTASPGQPRRLPRPCPLRRPRGPTRPQPRRSRPGSASRRRARRGGVLVLQGHSPGAGPPLRRARHSCSSTLAAGPSTRSSSVPMSSPMDIQRRGARSLTQRSISGVAGDRLLLRRLGRAVRRERGRDRRRGHAKGREALLDRRDRVRPDGGEARRGAERRLGVADGAALQAVGVASARLPAGGTLGRGSASGGAATSRGTRRPSGAGPSTPRTRALPRRPRPIPTRRARGDSTERVEHGPATCRSRGAVPWMPRRAAASRTVVGSQVTRRVRWELFAGAIAAQEGPPMRTSGPTNDESGRTAFCPGGSTGPGVRRRSNPLHRGRVVRLGPAHRVAPPIATPS